MNSKVIQKILNKFLQIIRQADYSVVDADISAYPKGQATSNGKATDIVRMSTYGVCANPPKDCHILMLQNQGQESTKFGIFNDFLNRKKGLAEGECALFNTLTGAMVYMKADGSIAVESPTSIDADAPIINVSGTTVNIVGSSAVNAQAPIITLDGNVVCTGTMAVSGALTASEVTVGSVTFSTHVHGGVDPGTGTSGGPQ